MSQENFDDKKSKKNLLVYRLKNALKNPRENFKWGIDQFSYDEKNRTLNISGWVFSLKGSEAVDLSIPLKKGMKIKNFKRIFRGDVTNEFGLTPGLKAGFEVQVEFPEGSSVPKSQSLILTDRATGIENSILASRPDPYHYNPYTLSKYYYNLLKQNGPKHALKQLIKQKNQKWDEYNFWLEGQEALNSEAILKDIEGFEKTPKISIVVPVYNLEEKYLRAMIDSVRNQYYTNWELILADDNSPSPHVKRILSEYAAEDDRIIPVFRDRNGHISEATNSALDKATGDFIGFMDHDDELSPDALYEYVKLINENEDADLIYCDQDFITTDGFHTQPFFKSDWNPRLLLGHNYITHFVVVSRDLYEKTGKLRTDYNGSQDYDFLLRASSKANGIYHIPKILYYWRMVEGSVAENPEAKNYAYVAGQKALNNHLLLDKKPGEVEIGEFYGTYKLTRKDTPSVSVIIVDENGEQARKTLSYLLGSTDYPNYKIIAVNFKKEVGTLEPEKVDYVYNNKPMSYNELLKFGASKAKGEYLAFVKAGMVPKSTNWLTNLVNETVEAESGIIGGLILDSEDKILNAGMSYDYPSEKIIYPYYGKRLDEDPLGYYYRLNLPQNVMAVSSFCFLISRELWDELEGFGEFTHPLAEIDLALRALKTGKRTVFTPATQFVFEGPVNEIAREFPEEDVLYYAREPLYSEIKKLLDTYSREELRDIYTNEVMQRYRRRQDETYDGPIEEANV